MNLASGAEVSECGRYRYRLERRWGSGPVGVFIGINPSTADAMREDATTRKWRGFAERFGWSGYIAVNAFGYRSTDQRLLLAAVNPVGDDNDMHIAEALAEASCVVPCWGPAKTPAVRRRLDARLRAMRFLFAGLRLHCLGTSQDGSPRHPLMLSYDVPLEPWQFAAAGVHA